MPSPSGPGRPVHDCTQDMKGKVFARFPGVPRSTNFQP